MSHLFSRLDLGPLSLENRIIIAAMCQYSADNGSATDWHIGHLSGLAQSGAGLMFLEDTAISPEGRITWGDLGLWDDVTEAALARVLAPVRKYSAMPIGIQLGHAGRKASTGKPWEGGGFIAASEPHGWQTLGPSTMPFNEDGPVPSAASEADIAKIIADFANSARRADRLGLDAIEIQGAHGYLLHQFLSPLANHREDRYGGSLENRMRLLLEVFDAIRGVFSASKPVGMRISAMDWVDGGWNLEQSIVLAQELERRGCAFIHVSSSGASSLQKIPVAPGFQVPLASAIKKAVKTMPVIAVGLITTPAQAEKVLVDGDADAVALARGILFQPRWPWLAAIELGATLKAAPQYLRSGPFGVKSPLV